MAHFRDPQARRVHRHQHRATGDVIARREQPRDLLARQQLRLTLRNLGSGNDNRRLAPLEHLPIQEPAGAGGLIDRAIGELAFLEHVQQPGFDLICLQALQTAVVVVARQPHQRLDVALLGAQRKPSHHHRIAHPLA